MLHTVLDSHHLQISVLRDIFRVFEVSFEDAFWAEKSVLIAQLFITDEQIDASIGNFLADAGDAHDVVTRHFLLLLKVSVTKALRVDDTALDSVDHGQADAIGR